MSHADTLAGVWLFAGMSKEQLQSMTAFTFARTFKPGEVIIEEGRTGNGLYAITTGRVEVVKGFGTENARRLATLGPGDFFGEMALLDDSPRSATVRTLQETACVGVDRWLFLAQIRKNPDMAIIMLQALARRLRALDAKLSQ